MEPSLLAVQDLYSVTTHHLLTLIVKQKKYKKTKDKGCEESWEAVRNNKNQENVCWIAPKLLGQ